mmetsp:Transcript_9040/g.12983  ORF Transcript_9040/g.12983 Transcript_9040/m.12983 type:complete len:83 (+) Transcript_9040:1051-1299(+)
MKKLGIFPIVLLLLSNALALLLFPLQLYVEVVAISVEAMSDLLSISLRDESDDCSSLHSLLMLVLPKSLVWSPSSCDDDEAE